MQAMDFLVALFFGWEKVICIRQKKKLVERLLMVDYPKHALEHCLMGLSGWTNPVLL